MFWPLSPVTAVWRLLAALEFCWEKPPPGPLAASTLSGPAAASRLSSSLPEPWTSVGLESPRTEVSPPASPVPLIADWSLLSAWTLPWAASPMTVPAEAGTAAQAMFIGGSVSISTRGQGRLDARTGAAGS
jgi:hypothetical protein